VATTHSVGSRVLNPVTSQGDLETLLSDKEFLIAGMRDYPFVDKNKLGVFGAGFGGLESLLLAMRNPDVDAVASLRGIYNYRNNFEFARQSPYYGIANMSVDMLQMFPPGTEELDMSLFESLRYSQRYSLKLKKLQDRDFVGYNILASTVEGSQVQNLEDKTAGHETINRHVLEFFNARLKNDEEASNYLEKSLEENGPDSPDFTMKAYPKQDLPPTAEQFMAIIREKGVTTACELYDRFKDDNPDHVFFREAPFNFLGYQYLQRNQIDDAITIFKMNAEAYPHSCNVWDSYADGLTRKGDTTAVREMMKKALEVMPNDTITNQATKDAIRAHAEQVLGPAENQ
jgi:tetratricopeptide (TPR) repeat protein